jgi:hypothetical protein
MEKKAIDRDKTCPFLLRLFWKINEPVTIEDLKHRPDHQALDEIRLYVWKDSTFREIVDMVKENLPEARRRDSEFHFSFLRQNLEGGFEMKNIGMLHSTRKVDLDGTPLQHFRFVIGDFIALRITFSLS